MHNLNLLITGSIGSGKSSLARILLQRSPRAVVIDPNGEYETGAIGGDFGSSVDYYCRHRFAGNFRLICRFDSTDEYRAFLSLIKEDRIDQLNTGITPEPLCLFLEEIHQFTGTHSIETDLDKLYLMSRHYCLNLCAIIQSDVDVHRTVRQNTHIVVAFRQMKLTTDMERRFPNMHDRMSSLKKFNPTIEDHPINGVHFMTYPPDIDVVSTWEKVSRGEWADLDSVPDSLDSEKETVDTPEDSLVVDPGEPEPSSEPTDSPVVSDSGNGSP